jgi:hypothetical protein
VDCEHVFNFWSVAVDRTLKMPIKTVWMVFLFAVFKQNGLIGDRIMWIANRCSILRM